MTVPRGLVAVADDITQTSWSPALRRETFTASPCSDFPLCMTLLLAWAQQSPVVRSLGCRMEPTHGLWGLSWNISASFIWEYHMNFFTFLILSHLPFTTRLTFFCHVWLCHDFICLPAFVLLHHSKCWIKWPFFTLREEVAYLVCMHWVPTHFQPMSLQCGVALVQRALSLVVSCNSNFHFSMGVFAAPAITYE